MREKGMARNTGATSSNPNRITHTHTHTHTNTHTHTQLLLTSVAVFCTATVHALKAIPQIRWIAHTNFQRRYTSWRHAPMWLRVRNNLLCYLYICGVRTGGSRTCALTFQLQNTVDVHPSICFVKQLWWFVKNVLLFDTDLLFWG